MPFVFFVDNLLSHIPMSTLTSYNPWDNSPVTEVPLATEQSIGDALGKARLALRDWSADYEARKHYILRMAELLKQHRNELSTLISKETGKVLWESQAEVDAMANKCAISVRAQEERRTSVSRGQLSTTYRPHGIALVLGPFNFPGHLPWGHICPALLAGNTVLFKPSEKAPGVADMIEVLLKQAELPQGVFQVLHGGADVATHLIDSDIDAVLFTGSYAVGTRILQRLTARPGVMTALEMGGNNPLIAWDVINLQAALIAIVQSAFATAGQRCSCARRLIVKHNDPLIEALLAAAQRLLVGKWDDEPSPFYSCLISSRAADDILAAQARLIADGYSPILSAARSDRSPSLVSPGLLLSPSPMPRHDDEIFGPLLQIHTVHSFEEALASANATRYGLSAGLLTDNPDLWPTFRTQARAGVLSLNRPTTGASSELPFGGIGHSGNHRPSAYHAAEYCSYPVAEMATPTLALPEKLPPGLQT